MKILYNAHIYTLDEKQPTATALVIQDDAAINCRTPSGGVVAVGRDDAILAEFAGRGEAINLEGRVIIPGLTDAHFHLETYALGLQKVDCETAARSECLERVAACADQTPPGEWVLGHGWNQNNWPEGFGRAADLDAVTSRHPVYLTAKSLHAAWANHEALRRAGITAATPDPQDGKLGRDKHGNPDGLLFEAAMALVAAHLPTPTVAQSAEAILQAQPVLWRMGLTGVHDFDRRRCFAALQTLHANGKLGLRVLKSIALEYLPQAIELGLRTGFGDDWLRTGSVKAFADGALGPQTAAMIQPYEGYDGEAASARGMLFMDAEALVEAGRKAVENGLSLAVHAIGDRANHEVLNAFEQLRAYEQSLPARSPGSGHQPRPGEASLPPGLRHRIEHVQLLHPDDAGRLAQLEVIASMQPIHATSDMLMADRYWGQRAALSYAPRTQLLHGARLAFGSDAPVESPNPFWGLHAAVTRRRQDGSPASEGWFPEQRLSLLEALHGFTTGPAYAAGMETRLGRLAPGFHADLLVLDQDPFASDPTSPSSPQLYTLQPSAVMLGGAWVWRQ